MVVVKDAALLRGLLISGSSNAREPAATPNGGRITAFPCILSHQRPPRVSEVVREETPGNDRGGVVRL
jgi:hypothetical protein